MRPTHPVIAPAIMASEWESLVAQIELIAPVARQAQIDVMDGVLVPARSFPYNETTLTDKKLPEGITFESHLMVQKPREVGLGFIAAGCERVTAQVEGFEENFIETVEIWREAGAQQVGVSIMLDTDTSILDDIVEYIDSIQVMSIARIGFQGEPFDERALVRIRELRAQYPDVTISVDGGVNENTLELLLKAGADIFGVGSAIMKASNPEGEYARLQELLESYAQ